LDVGTAGPTHSTPPPRGESGGRRKNAGRALLQQRARPASDLVRRREIPVGS
jgi:hypothetical protein